MPPTLRFLLALLAGLLLACSGEAAETTRYDIYAEDGSRAGEQVVERTDDGLTRVRFSYRNNGRGPDIDERFRVAPDGTLTDYHATGATTFGSVVDERYARTGDRAAWRSTTEDASRQVDGSAFYMPMNGSLEVVSASIGALAARADGRLPLLPSGVLTQRSVDEVELSRDGRTQRVQLVVQRGQGLNPSLYWATTGAAPRLFAAIYPGWLVLIENGWKDSAPTLATRQKAAESALLKELAARTLHPLPGLTVIRNARVFDSDTAQLTPLSDVYVLRGRITAVLPSGSRAAAADWEIDAAGRVMLPGLFDMHGHVDTWDGGLHLAAGVTTVRDMGNDNQRLQRIIDDTAAGELLQPQIVPCGFLEGESPYAARLGIIIRTLDEAKRAVDWYAQRGYPQLKIYNSFPREHLRETVAHAHGRGMRVSGHVPAFMRAEEVVEQGFDEIQHINQVMLNFLVTPSTDTRTLDRFYLPAERLHALDPESRPVQDFIAKLKRHGTVIDPTLATFAFIRQRDGELAEPYAPIVGHLPADVQRRFRSGGMKIPDDATAARYRASYARMVDFVGRLHRAGVPLVAGTDDIAGFTLQAELALYVDAGLTPAQALQVATRNGARYSGTSADRGRIAPGMRADLVLVDGDPTRDIADLRRVALVLTQGRYVAPDEVYRALGIEPFAPAVPVLPAATTAASAAVSR